MALATVWYNAKQKKHFATEVGRGRPLPQNAASYEGSGRTLYSGATREEALGQLFEARGLTRVEIVTA